MDLVYKWRCSQLPLPPCLCYFLFPGSPVCLWMWGADSQTLPGVFLWVRGAWEGGRIRLLRQPSKPTCARPEHWWAERAEPRQEANTGVSLKQLLGIDQGPGNLDLSCSFFCIFTSLLLSLSFALSLCHNLTLSFYSWYMANIYYPTKTPPDKPCVCTLDDIQ